MSTLVAPDAGRVRVATRDDAPALIDVARAYHTEHDLGPFSEDKVTDLLRRAFTVGANDPVLIGVAGTEKVEGSVCIVVDTPRLGDAPFLEVVWCHVLAPFRSGTTHAKDLIAFAERWAMPPPVGIGVPLKMRLRLTHKTESQGRLLRRVFGEPLAQEWIVNAADLGGAA